jgi:hypothetical protein
MPAALLFHDKWFVNQELTWHQLIFSADNCCGVIPAPCCVQELQNNNETAFSELSGIASTVICCKVNIPGLSAAQQTQKVHFAIAKYFQVHPTQMVVRNPSPPRRPSVTRRKSLENPSEVLTVRMYATPEKSEELKARVKATAAMPLATITIDESYMESTDSLWTVSYDSDTIEEFDQTPLTRRRRKSTMNGIVVVHPATMIGNRRALFSVCLAFVSG